MDREVKTTKCGVCWYPALISGWLPPPGLEPHLRQFKCPKCGSLTYKTIAPGKLAIKASQSTQEDTAGQA